MKIIQILRSVNFNFGIIVIKVVVLSFVKIILHCIIKILLIFPLVVTLINKYYFACMHVFDLINISYDALIIKNYY